MPNIKELRRKLKRRCSVAIIKHSNAVGWFVDGYYGYNVSQGYHNTERAAIEAALCSNSYYLDRH